MTFEGFLLVLVTSGRHFVCQHVPAYFTLVPSFLLVTSEIQYLSEHVSVSFVLVTERQYFDHHVPTSFVLV